MKPTAKCFAIKQWSHGIKNPYLYSTISYRREGPHSLLKHSPNSWEVELDMDIPCGHNGRANVILQRIIYYKIWLGLCYSFVHCNVTKYVYYRFLKGLSRKGNHTLTLLYRCVGKKKRGSLTSFELLDAFFLAFALFYVLFHL